MTLPEKILNRSEEFAGAKRRQGLLAPNTTYWKHADWCKFSGTAHL